MEFLSRGGGLFGECYERIGLSFTMKQWS